MSIQEYAVFKRDLEADAREDGFELTMPATAADFERGGIIGSVGLGAEIGRASCRERV